MITFPAEHGLDLGSNVAHTILAVQEDDSWVDQETKLHAIANIPKDINVSPDTDLFYARAILATSTENLNADVFLPHELWAARKTPVDKPMNMDHLEAKNVGHISLSFPVNSAGELLPDDLAPEDVPDLFHLVIGAVVYKTYRDEELQAQADLLIEAIQSGEMAVSMECMFDNFAYLLKKDGVAQILERNEETAFLTRHLRIYGGEGEYKGYSISRVLRDITFSGCGYTLNPANPDSKILQSGEISDFSFAKKNLPNPFGVHSVCKDNSILENQKMADTDHGAELKDAQAQIRELQEALAKADAAKFETRIEDLTAQVQDRDEKLEVSATALEEKEKALACMCDKYAELEKEKNELQAKFAELEGELKGKARVQVFLDKNYPLEEAKAEAAKFSSFSDENFKLLVDVLPTRKEVASTESTDQPVLKLEEVAELQSVATTESVSQTQSKADERKSAVAAISEAYAEHFGVKEKK